ncbi:MAG: molybdopterin-dependent oxidoreductase [Arenicellales bacterium]|nr:molybdopterin-dependent oxidoreductase [Arenicellales bacterium]
MSDDTQLIFVVDIERCVKCRACETSCKIANGVNRGDIFYRKVRILEGGTYPHPTRQFVSMSCNHCTDPPCVRGCPTEARTKHPETGVLILDQEICMGCQYCTWACPYGAISYNPSKGVVEQCDFCAERRQDGLDPACVTACMSGALQYGTRADFDMSGLANNFPGTPEAGISDPNIYYRNQMGPSRRLHNDVYLKSLSEYTPSLCMLCGSQCGVMVKTKKDKVVDIRPNPHCPNNISNNSEVFHREVSDPYAAKLCAKGYSASQALDDPDRVSTPLKRIGERGEGRWEEISWEQAYQEIANRLNGIREDHGPHTLVWMTEDASYIPIQQDFCAAFGTPNFLMHSNLCDVSRKAGCTLALGHSRPLSDLAQTRLAVLFGWNLVAAIKWAHLVPDLMRAREQGAELIVVDPVFSDTAAKADRWIPIRPGTDGALALAIAHVLIREDLIDHGFVESWTKGFEEFAAQTAAWTPDWAEEITGIPAADILWLARKIGTVRPAVIDGWSGPSHRSNGTLNLYAITLLNALIGMVDEPGGLHIPDERPHLKHRPPHPDWPEIREPRVDRLETYPLGHESGIYTEVVRAMLEGTPYQPRALVLNFQNPVLSIPDRGRTVRAMQSPEMELIVSLDTMLSDSASLADYVIPGTVYLERTDLNVFWVNFAAIGLRQPVVAPRFGQPTEPDFIIELARRLGLPGFDMDYADYLDDMLRRSLDMSIETLRATPGAVWVGGETEYRKYARETEGRPRGFATPSGKVEFLSAKLKGLVNHRTGGNYSGFPEYLPPEVDVDDEYPLYLVNWKQAEHTHSRTQNNAWLSAMKPDNRLWINTVTARHLDLVEGEEVQLESPFGCGRVRVHLTEGIHPDVVGLQHGFGARELGRNARGRGASDNSFLRAESERLSGMAIHKETKVRVSPINC